jgi:hypothetical protein
MLGGLCRARHFLKCPVFSFYFLDPSCSFLCTNSLNAVS